MAEEIVWSARLGAHLEAWRVRAHMRRLDLAAQLAVSEETIRLWEKGVVQPFDGPESNHVPSGSSQLLVEIAQLSVRSGR